MGVMSHASFNSNAAFSNGLCWCATAIHLHAGSGSFSRYWAQRPDPVQADQRRQVCLRMKAGRIASLATMSLAASPMASGAKQENSGVLSASLFALYFHRTPLHCRCG